MKITEHIIFQGEKLPIVNTPVTKNDYNELTDKYRKFLLRDYKLGKVYPVYSNRINKSFSFDFGERGMFYLGSGVIGLLLLLYTKKKVEKFSSKFNPFHMPEDLREFLDNIENKTPKNSHVAN